MYDYIDDTEHLADGWLGTLIAYTPLPIFAACMWLLCRVLDVLAWVWR